MTCVCVVCERAVWRAAGEELCQQGDVADCLWILAEGTVEAVRYK
jgi:hypothetical protein